jgi:hypothetical protein
MRQILQPQIPIVHQLVDHTHGYELVVMSQILDDEPAIAKLVFADLTRLGAAPLKRRDHAAFASGI